MAADQRPLRILALVLVAAMLAGCARQHSGAGGRSGPGGRRAGASPPPVPLVTATSKTVKPSLSIAGIIAPFQNVAITSSLSEPTNAVNVNEGDHVHAGEILAVLDTSDLQANLDAQIKTAQSSDAKVAQAQYNAQLTVAQAPDQVTTARAALKQAQQTLAQAQADLTRDRQLVTNGYLAQQAYQQQETTVNNDAAAVRSAQASLASAISSQQVNGTQSSGLQGANVAAARADAAAAYAAAEQYRTQIAKATIVSPVDGVVMNRNLNPGEYPSGRTLFTIQALASVYAELNASSADVFRIPNGSNVALAVSGASASNYNGKVVAVLGQVTPGSTNFTVKVLVQNADGKLQAGVPVTGTIALPATTGVGVPTAAFLDDTHTSVMANVNGKASIVKVSEITSDGVTSIVKGLSNGAKIVADGQLGVTSGQVLADANAPKNPQASPGADATPPGDATPAPDASPGETGASPNPAASGHHRHRHAQGDASSAGTSDASGASP